MTVVLEKPYSTPAPAEWNIRWERLPADFALPDDPVDNLQQPLLASALSDALSNSTYFQEEMIVATNFGLCATVNGKTVIKAPDWVLVPKVANYKAETHIRRRSYTPHLEGDVPSLVMEFLSESEGGEYSIKPHYPYGKWRFYEQILQIPYYVIFDPETSLLEVYQLSDKGYQAGEPNAEGRFWIATLNLFIGVWHGTWQGVSGHWLRFWDRDGDMLLWANEKAREAQSKAHKAEIEAQQERERNKHMQGQLERLNQRLKDLGLEPEQL